MSPRETVDALFLNQVGVGVIGTVCVALACRFRFVLP